MNEQAGVLSGGRWRDLASLNQRAARAANGFDALGIGEDGAVALYLRNDFAFFEASFAAVLIGAYAVPINWHYTADEAGYILRDCEARALIVHADLLARIADGIPAGVRVLVVETPPEIQAAYAIADDQAGVPAGAEGWDAFVAAHEPWSREPRSQRATMIYTSGTTGRPKGVRRDPVAGAAVERMHNVLRTVFDLGPDRRVRAVVTGPMYHSAPNAYGLAAVRDGGFVVLQPRFDAVELLALIAQHRLSHMHMVPTMFVRLLKLPAAVRARHDLSSLKWVVHAAAPCPADIKRQMIDWWGPVIVEYYGATETGAVVFHDSREALAKPGTVGRALERAEVRIVDDDGRELGPGEIGEIYLRVHDFPDFTYNKDDAKRRSIAHGDLVSAGDVGYLDADGYLFLCDRRNDMVISGGVNIYPAEIEGVLIEHEGVRDCAVFGIPDAEFGEALCAHVELAPGVRLDPEAVRDFLRQRIAGYKVPKVVEFAASLPREDSGKIFKRKLRDPYWQDAGRSI